jgi:phosphoribosylformimino-5-aminoimidazole carboxamide ribotide isomerase
VTFEVLPSIDLRAGRVVRLRQGDFTAETVYESDPVTTARGFVEAGARWIHVVDLDGARSGARVQGAVVASIVEAVGQAAACQVAGGLRTLDAVAAAFDSGAGRVVVGTAALLDREFAGSLIARYGPGRVVVALDVRDGLALGQGWRPGAVGLPVEVALLHLAEVGVERFAVTGVDRDGLLDGPDLELLRRLVGLARGTIVASGGVSSIDDLRAVRGLGCTGAIVGRALYEGRLDLGEAIAALAD